MWFLSSASSFGTESLGFLGSRAPWASKPMKDHIYQGLWAPRPYLFCTQMPRGKYLSLYVFVFSTPFPTQATTALGTNAIRSMVSSDALKIFKYRHVRVIISDHMQLFQGRRNKTNSCTQGERDKHSTNHLRSLCVGFVQRIVGGTRHTHQQLLAEILGMIMVMVML